MLLEILCIENGLWTGRQIPCSPTWHHALQKHPQGYRMWRTPALRCLTNARGSIHESSWHGEPQFRIQLGNLCPKINGFRVSRTSFFWGPIPKILLQTTPSAKGLCLLKTGLLACNRRFTWVRRGRARLRRKLASSPRGVVWNPINFWHHPTCWWQHFINSSTQQTSRYFKGL